MITTVVLTVFVVDGMVENDLYSYINVLCPQLQQIIFVVNFVLMQ